MVSQVYEVPEQSTPQTQKAQQWSPGAAGRSHGELMVNGYRVPVWQDEKVLEMEGGDGR